MIPFLKYKDGTPPVKPHKRIHDIFFLGHSRIFWDFFLGQMTFFWDKYCKFWDSFRDILQVLNELEKNLFFLYLYSCFLMENIYYFFLITFKIFFWINNLLNTWTSAKINVFVCSYHYKIHIDWYMYLASKTYWDNHRVSDLLYTVQREVTLNIYWVTFLAGKKPMVVSVLAWLINVTLIIGLGWSN